MLQYGEKAGMQGIDKEKIAKIIEANTGEKYQAFSKKKQTRIDEKNAETRLKISHLTPVGWAKSEREMDSLASVLELERDLCRHCVHIDMDAFFAAVEMRDSPRYRTVPMAVGGMSMLSTSNYLARRFGVRAAMPGFIALRLCPQLEIVPGSYDKYRKESKVFASIFSEYDEDMGMGSLDEAYVDITDYMESRTRPQTFVRRRYSGDCQCRLPYASREVLEKEGLMFDSALLNTSGKDDLSPLTSDSCIPSTSDTDTVTECSLKLTGREQCTKCSKERLIVEDTVEFGISRSEVVREIRFRVEQATGLTCSAGIASNFMLAKICSDLNKPNGQYELANDKEKILSFLKDLPIRKVCGIGRVSESHLQVAGILTVGDIWLRRAVLPLCFSELSTESFLRVSMGLSGRPSSSDPKRKSISVETTFSPSSLTSTLRPIVKELCDDLATQLEKANIVGGKNVTLKLRLATFDVLTRAVTVDHLVSTGDQLFTLADNLLTKELGPEMRLLGVRLSKLSFTDEQLEGPPKKKSLADFWKRNNTEQLKYVEEEIDEQLPTTSKEGNEREKEEEKCTVSCPICGMRLVDDDSQVNRHLDECLNRGVLTEMQRNEESVQNKEKTDSGRQKKSSPKKTNKVGKPVRTLDHFFKKGG